MNKITNTIINIPAHNQQNLNILSLNIIDVTTRLLILRTSGIQNSYTISIKIIINDYLKY